LEVHIGKVKENMNQYVATNFVLQMEIMKHNIISCSRGSPNAAVNLFPCDHEVMGSSPRNSILQKCRERLRT
jgi:hypothetical protein